MVRSLQLLLASAVALLLAAPVSAASSVASTVSLTGTLSSVHEDALGTFRESDQFFLASGGASYELRFADGGPDGGNGAEVTVTGRLEGHTLLVAGPARTSLRVLRQAPVSAVTTGASSPTATTSGIRTAAQPALSGGAAPTASIAAVLVNLSDLGSRPYTTSQVASALYGSTGSVKSFFQEESKGRMSVTGKVFGWYTIPATSAGCDWSTWVTLASTAANAAGASLSSFTNVMYIVPYTSQCAFAGLGYVPGTVTVLNGNLSVQVMTHELGHNFGLGHANGLNCAENGTRVAISDPANCTEAAYVDPFSTMGNNALRHNQGSQLGELGWLSSTEKVIGAPGNTYTISPYFGSGPVKLVRIPRGDGSFFDLDFRMAYGSFDNFAPGSPAVSGVTIRLGRGTASPTGSPQATQLIDTMPSTSSWADAPLLAGRTLTDPVSGISITTLSVTSGVVQVRVRESIAPSAPGTLTATPAADGTSVALAWGPATDNTAVASYAISRNGTSMATVSAAAQSWSDAGTALGASYTYSVTAIDTSGNRGTPTTAVVSMPADPNAAPAPSPTANPNDLQPPTAPEPLSGTAATTSVTLTWGAASDDVGVTGYVVARDGTPVATVTGTSWTDTARMPSTSYTYTVSAMDTGAHEGPAATVQVTTTPDAHAPSTPRTFHKVRQSGRYVTFGWQRSTDNVKVAKYLLYRVGRSSPIAHTTSLSIRIYTTRGATYEIRAVDAAGNRSGVSTRVRITS